MGKSTQILAGIMSLVPRLVRAEVAKMEPVPGPQGDAGPLGDRGARGQRGERGYAIADASIIDDVLHLTLDDDENRVFAVGKVVGPQGETGARGLTGESGENGVDGAAGREGMQGTTGGKGGAGIDGAPGADGINGIDGVNGATGENGLDGAPGADGADGIDGKAGQDGTDGVQGEQGLEGSAGKGIEKAFVAEGKLVVAYADGEQSEVGYVVGERGQRGVKGTKGAAGARGLIGRSGLGVVWLGAYDVERTYYGQFAEDNPTPGQAAMVRHNGGVYIALGETSEEPRVDSEFWDVFV
jgi:hypothetical protein